MSANIDTYHRLRDRAKRFRNYATIAQTNGSTFFAAVQIANGRLNHPHCPPLDWDADYRTAMTTALGRSLRDAAVIAANVAEAEAENARLAAKQEAEEILRETTRVIPGNLP